MNLKCEDVSDFSKNTDRVLLGTIRNVEFEKNYHPRKLGLADDHPSVVENELPSNDIRSNAV